MTEATKRALEEEGATPGAFANANAEDPVLALFSSDRRVAQLFFMLMERSCVVVEQECMTVARLRHMVGDSYLLSVMPHLVRNCGLGTIVAAL